MPHDQTPNPPRPRVDFALAASVFLITLAVFWSTTGYDFVGIDDGSFVTENQAVLDGLSWPGISEAFGGFRASNWVPLSLVSLMVDSSLQGTGPAGYHRTNVVLHALNALLLFALARRLGAGSWAAAVAALLFTLHPMRAESVAWISERRDVLSTAFWFAATIMWVDWTRTHKAWHYLAVALLFALGLLSKGMLVTFPVTLMILDWWPLRREISLRQSMVEKIPLFAMSALIAAITLAAQGTGTAMTALDALGPLDRVLNAIVGYATYLGRMLWPMDLSYFYPHPSFVPPYEGWSSARVAVSVAALAVMTLGALRLARGGWRAPLAGWAWYVITLLPVIGLVQVGMQATADRYSYVPQVGLIAVVVAAGIHAAKRWRAAVALATCVVLAVSGWLTVRELPHWKNSEALFGRALEVDPRNGFALAALGTHHARAGRNEQAAELLGAAIVATPRFAEAHANYGIVLVALGRDGEAEPELRLALASLPDHTRARLALGNLLARAGRLVEAAAEYERALQSPSPPWEAEFGLGQIARARGNEAGALRRFERALALARDPQDRARIQSALR